MAEVDDNGAKSYELAFEEAGRALDAQEHAVNELRSRAGVLIAAAAITTSFFGSRAITGDGLSGWVWVAVAAFILVGGCVLTVVWPSRSPRGSSPWRSGRRMGVMATKTASASPTAPPQPIKPSPMQGETRGGNGDAK